MIRGPTWQIAWVSIAVLLASSTWFAGTAAGPALIEAWALSASGAAWLTISVQLGFITGTLIYSMLSVADVWSARRVFAVSAVLGAAANLGFAALAGDLAVAIALRALTGVTLAGVYPVAMKIVASHFRSGLGWRLGLMVGALTAGTSLPYLSTAIGADLSWRVTAGSASGLALGGAAVMIALVDDGPHLTGRAPFDPRAFARVFSIPRFRLTALGYFGHMWELYAVWALVGGYLAGVLDSPRSIAAGSFAVVFAGAIGCAAGGWISNRAGERRVATVALITSAACCLASPLVLDLGTPVVIAFAVVWGLAVVADSPQLSALSAKSCPPEYTATALTIQNGVGFAITIASLQLLPLLAAEVGWRSAFLALAPGPIAGAFALDRLRRLPPDENRT
jgi:MFS family permease